MLFFKAIVGLTTIAFVSAQTTHIINATIASGTGPVFQPDQVTAAVGDLIQFQFYPGNHSVVRAAFANPCVPISTVGVAGFFSGFNPVTDPTPKFTIQVTDTDPIWFYCSQDHHCQVGMVGVINPTAQDTLAAFKSSAANAPNNVSPQQISGGFTSTSSAGSTSPTKTATGTGNALGSATTTSGTVSPSTSSPVSSPASSVTGGTVGNTTVNTSKPTGTSAAFKFGSSTLLVIAVVVAPFFLL